MRYPKITPGEVVQAFEKRLLRHVAQKESLQMTVEIDILDGGIGNNKITVKDKLVK